MFRPLQRIVYVFLLILLWVNVSPIHDSSAVALVKGEQQTTDQSQVHHATSEAIEAAKSRTQQIWATLRRDEPSWKESLIDARPSGIPLTVWHYLKIVFRTLFMNAPTRVSGEERTKLAPRLQEAVDGLHQSAGLDSDALFLLAEMSFYGNFSHPRNPKQARKLYAELATRDGNASAQHMLGVLYATGLGGLDINQAKAQLYYTFAAEQGHVRAEMTLAHRFHMGIGTAKSCERGVDYYKRVADKSMDWWLSGPPGGHVIQRNVHRWVDEAGGAYGEGASWTSSGPFAPGKNTNYESFDNVLEYLDMRERQGDHAASLQLGKHFYEPPRGYRRNLKKARLQFLKVALSYWSKDGSLNPKRPKNIDKTAARAAAYIGRMFLRGESMEQSYEKAATWFKRGVTNGDSFAQYHLGLMYRDGLGLPKDGNKAAAYLKAAGEQKLGIAQSALGALFLDQGDLDTASRYFELAKNADIMEGYYYLAEFANQGLGRQQNCHHAATYYKIVSEKAEALHSAFVEANSAYEKGDYERAFIASIMAAEQGYETGQSNAAFLLDQKTAVIAIPALLPIFSNPLESIPQSQRTKLLDNPKLAQIYYTRSAHQHNIDSLIKAGDYHRLGIGTPTRTLPVKSNKTTASLEAMYSCYSTAAEHPNAAQALWNMGWMHENGIGSVEQDFHMAKRYYDLAYEMNKEAYLPVKLALLRLRTRSWWNHISGGKVKSMEAEDDNDPESRNKKKQKPNSISEWLGRFLDAAVEMDAQEYAEMQRQQGGEFGDDDDLNHVAWGEPGMPGGDSEYHYKGRNGDGNGNPVGAGGDEFYDDFDDGLLESLVIIALAGALAMLVYVRQQRQRQQNRNQGQNQVQNNGAAPQAGVGPVAAAGQAQQGQQEQQQQGGQNGFFPNPGDPEYQNWVAGGVGH